VSTPLILDDDEWVVMSWLNSAVHHLILLSVDESSLFYIPVTCAHAHTELVMRRSLDAAIAIAILFVRLSVCYTDKPRVNGSKYRNTITRHNGVLP